MFTAERQISVITSSRLDAITVIHIVIVAHVSVPSADVLAIVD
jgi:hypothetical protein